MTTRPLYQVFRDGIDYHNDPSGGAQDSELRGSYGDYEEAKRAAKKDLTDEWDKDFFETYAEVENGGQTGLFQVNATCPEGEVMTVYIKKVDRPVPPSENDSVSTQTTQQAVMNADKAKTPTQKTNTPTSNTSTNSTIPSTGATIYHVFRHGSNDHQDSSGDTEGTKLRNSWWTYEAAVGSAKEDLIREYGSRDAFTEYHEEEEGDTGLFEVKAESKMKYKYHVYIEKGTISVPPPEHPFSAKVLPLSAPSTEAAPLAPPAPPSAHPTHARPSPPPAPVPQAARPSPSAVSNPATIMQRQIPLPTKGYIILRTDHPHWKDEEGNMSLEDETVYLPIAEANKAASRQLDEVEGRGWSDQDDDDDWQSEYERDERFVDDCFVGSVRLYRDDLDQVDIEVREMDISWPAQSALSLVQHLKRPSSSTVDTSGAGAAPEVQKRRRIDVGDAEVVDMTGLD
ncbi:uncharacterized protein I303_101643 [Kwoniella dejecticola CBS 10117]|uniref:Uncharacterized protein n=1 Tax=Kwoniella dejecticola CBS 10117 TaxID=1296121 RepID=A0A1A6AD73_9TREE|nr:uncharacterized protein I303_02221 [Kwoniella dejecticola CBS 10117]OBR88005.1 hypothetical protein I303_02221 [Kwoniella dejecticola CBS 10117]